MTLRFRNLITGDRFTTPGDTATVWTKTGARKATSDDGQTMPVLLGATVYLVS